ncbi:hypothetical protein EOM71_00205 [Candidatus Falkowbacteria bacterium]|nr:hypothetical protein [Candidatus Falkowbacteria bacterium]
MWRKLKSFFNDQWQQISHKQRYFIVGLIIFLILTPVLVFALDAVTTAILKILTGIISLLVSFFGKLLAVVLHVLIYVAQYNNFIKEQVVVEGWKVVRDVCNMFFVLGLLIIAFGTVLRLQNYQAKSLLRSFIFGAIFVNFSKTICGLILDFAQIIMLTFVNGFKDVGAGNLTEMLGLTALFDVVVNAGDSADTAALEGLGVFISYLLALVYIIVALVVILTMTIMLIQRAVMLWIYIILSPFPYLLSALPKAGKLGQAGGRWWSDFTGLVITGPMLAFFIWLSFFTASGSGMSDGTTEPDPNNIQLTGGSGSAVDPNGGSDLTSDINAGVTQSGTAQAIIKFLVSIGLLWGGMMLTKETSSLLGNVVGAGMSNLKNAGNKVKKTAAGMATGAAKNTAKWAGRNALKGGGAAIAGLTKNNNTKFGQAARKIGLAGKAWGEDLTENRQNEKIKKREATLKKLGFGEKSMKAFKDVANDDLVKGVGRTIKGAGSVAMGVAGMATGNPFLAAAGLAGIGIGVYKQSPLATPVNQLIKRGVGGSKTMAYEKAYKQYNGKITSAASTMDEERDKAKKDVDNGTINHAEYNERISQAIKKYKDAKIEAKEELARDQKRVSNPTVDQEMKNIDQTKKSKVDQANQEHSQQLETITETRKKEIKASEEAHEQTKDDNQRKFADGLISKDDLERLNVAADIQLKERQKQANNDYERDSKSATADRDQKIKDAKDQHQKDTQVQTDILDIASVTNPLDRLFAKLEIGGIVSKLADDAINYHPMQTTSSALGKGAKELENAQSSVESIATIIDAQALADALNKKMFSGGLKGLDSAQIKFYQSLVNGQNKKSQDAIDNLTAAIKKLDFSKNNDNEILNSLIKGIATFSKSGGDDSGRFKPLIDALNEQTDGGYDSFQPKAQKVKLREVGQAVIAGFSSGSLQIDSFAQQRSVVNIIGVDFNKLSFFNNIIPVDATAEIVGASIELANIPAVAKEINGLISQELLSLQQSDQADRISLLQMAQARLANPVNLSNLSLRNTSITLINTTENYLTSLHEALHGFGLTVEELVENVAKQMAKRFYPIDATAEVAKNLINITSQRKINQQQLSADDITQALKGIKPMSKVEQVIAKEINEDY